MVLFHSTGRPGRTYLSQEILRNRLRARQLRPMSLASEGADSVATLRMATHNPPASVLRPL